MKMIRSVIIDDEPGCISNLRYYLQQYCPQVEVFKTESRLSKIPDLLQENIDVAFLDIEICDDNIFNILKHTSKPSFDIVFVTAYEKYAIKAFNVDVLDYLLKPIKQESVINCYNKILRRFSQGAATENEHSDTLEIPAERKVVLKQGDKVYVAGLNDIVYMEAKGAYTAVCIYQNNKKHLITVSKSLAEISAEYTYQAFYKIHRSFIINKHKIAQIQKNGAMNIQMITGEIIPVARRRWLDFLSAKYI